jgi:hypothetical protein
LKRETVTRHGQTFSVVTLDTGEAPRKRPTHTVEFVKLPVFWIDKLAGQNGSVCTLAMQLLLLKFRSYTPDFKLTNAAVANLKMNRWAKGRALKQLERLGLISVVRMDGKAPLVNIISQ